ncbi:SprT-like family [Actinomyces bovis]|uniref:SprT-like family n=1 Tax=Actinomyces bovis TaxID=1658 RepID=A0ABY1VNG8_9ACTO|nr:SprT-like domain-containing protein [Actinomyces bovis]SPT53636.1 SprT-like family [Actinomyces bovis]VEG55702.1 SprT-like family [Actinomyces israelii]
MQLPEVLSLARQLLTQHGLQDWEVRLDRALRRAGQCDERRRRITVSRHLMELYTEAEVRETILHEVAHALVGNRHAHDAVWVAQARQIGASGARLVPHSAPRIKGRWVGHCPAGHEVDRTRRPTTPLACARCSRRFSLENLISWCHDGVPVAHEALGPGYNRALKHALRQARKRPRRPRG